MQGFTGKYLGFDFFLDRDYLLLLILCSVLGSFLRLILTYVLSQNYLNNAVQAANFAILPAVAFVITSIISSNIALSLGMVGALSIVRFRTPVKNPSELISYFMLITLGIVVNVNQNYAVNFALYLLLIASLVRIGLAIISKINKTNTFYELSSNIHYLNIVSEEKIENLGESSILYHESFNESKYMYILKSKSKKQLNEILNSIKKEEITSYSMDLDQNEN